MHSLFEEQIIQDSFKLNADLERTSEVSAEAMDYLPTWGQYSVGPESYLKTLSKIKQAVKIPVFGSLNGVTTGGWVEYAQKIQEAGADAFELNMYYLATDPDLTSTKLEEDLHRAGARYPQTGEHPIGHQAQPVRYGAAQLCSPVG